MKNWDEDDDSEWCTAEQDLADAQQVADCLGIPLHTVNFAAEYWDLVFTDFLSDYKRGLTPNPDVECNRVIKFDLFLQYADALGIDTVATGHYARSVTDDGEFSLQRSTDLSKDQTYFLQTVPKDKLARAVFPLADLNKTEVREIARKAGFKNHDKPDSTGICFIGERPFRDFLNQYIKGKPGDIKTGDGTVLGTHVGLEFYTYGQRKGLGIGGVTNAKEAPWFVVQKSWDTNELLVSQNEEDLACTALIAKGANWLVDEVPDSFLCEAVVRYRAPAVRCRVAMRSDSLNVEFDEPQRACTPGQYVAFYHADRCLGGARIASIPEFRLHSSMEDAA